MAKILVKELKFGDQVKCAFLATRKELRTTKKGDPFLALELADRSGSIEAKVWERAESLKDVFAEKDFVEVTGSVSRYRDVLQLEVQEIRVLRENEVEPADFVRSCEGNIEEMEQLLLDMIESVRNPYLSELLRSFFGDEELAVKFRRAPAAKFFHHAYVGGLLEHTLNVCRLAGLVGGIYPEIDRDILLTAAMLHDFGKVEELGYGRSIDYTEEGQFLGHMLLADEMLREHIEGITGFPRDLALRLRHAVLSHHGELEWGAPKRPKTVEALILHHIDNLDAKMSGFLDIVERGSQESGWTDMKNHFRRPLYAPPPATVDADGFEEQGTLL